MFTGYEVLSAEGMMQSHGHETIRITVLGKKVGLSGPLLKALDYPSHISFHRGVGENEGKMIIATAEREEEPGRIQIDPKKKKVFFHNNDFVAMCGEMIQAFSGGTFKKGTYFSIMGTPAKTEGQPAFVFDFRDGMERCVKAVYKGHAASGRKVVHSSPGFNMPSGYTAARK